MSIFYLNPNLRLRVALGAALPRDIHTDLKDCFTRIIACDQFASFLNGSSSSSLSLSSAVAYIQPDPPPYSIAAACFPVPALTAEALCNAARVGVVALPLRAPRRLLFVRLIGLLIAIGLSLLSSAASVLRARKNFLASMPSSWASPYWMRQTVLRSSADRPACRLQRGLVNEDGVILIYACTVWFGQ